MFEFIKAGGWLMLPIVACSLAAATIIFERLLALRRARVLPGQLVAMLRRWTEQGAHRWRTDPPSSWFPGRRATGC